eukprot:4490998-Prymnesium_polylepis.1
MLCVPPRYGIYTPLALCGPNAKIHPFCTHVKPQRSRTGGGAEDQQRAHLVEPLLQLDWHRGRWRAGRSAQVQ